MAEKQKKWREMCGRGLLLKKNIGCIEETEEMQWLK